MGWEGPIDAGAGAGANEDERRRAWAAPGSSAEPSTPYVHTPPAAPASTPRAAPPVPMPRAPMTVAEIIDGSFLLLKARPRTVLLVSAIFSVPFQVLGAWLQRGLLEVSSESTADPFAMTATEESTNVPYLAIFLVLLLTTLPLPFVGAVLSRLAAGWYAGRDLTTGEALREGLLPRKWLWLLLAWIPVHIAETIASFALMLPALFVMIFFQCVAPVIALENVGPGKAVARSARLVTRRYGWALLIGFLSIVLAYALENALGFLPGLVIPFAPSSLQWVLVAVVDSLVAIFVVPVVVSISVLLYFDLRIRTEGLDLELRATEVFEPAAQGA